MSASNTPSSTGNVISTGILGIFAKTVHVPIIGPVPLGVGLLGLGVLYFGFIRKRGTKFAVVKL